MDKTSAKYQSICICLVLALITTAVFYHVCTYDFINYDDPIYVYENPNIQAGITPGAVKWAFTTGYGSNWFPLTWLSHMLDWQLYGQEPAGHHFTNLIFHVANTLLLFIVLKQMTRRLWPSAFVAALFALHPLHVESVAWVAERKDVLSTFFWILTMWAYLRYVKHPGVARYLLTLLLFALGLMAKPMLVTLPFVLLLLDYWPLARVQFKQAIIKTDRQNRKHTDSDFYRRPFYHLIREKIPFFVLSGISSVVTFLVQQSGGTVAKLVSLPLKIRVFNVPISYVEYIGEMIWPVHLAVFYPYAGRNVSVLYAVISFVILLAVTILIFRFAKERRYLVVGWLWYLGTLVPVIGLIQVGSQAIANRYTYIPLTGLFIIIAWGLPDLLAKWRYKKAALIASALLVIVAMSVCTYYQLRHWQNSITLFQHDLDVTKNNYVAHFNMADRFLKEGKLNEAIYHYSEIIRINPHSTKALNCLGTALCKTGRVDEAIEKYQKSLQIKPDDLEVLNALGAALGQQGKFDKAIECFSKVLRIRPNSVYAHTNMGYALMLQGDFDGAAVHLTEALRLDPNVARAHYYLGKVLAQKGKVHEAIAHFEESLRLEPDWVEPMNALAWFLATSKETTIHNPGRAIRLAQRACGHTDYKEPYFLDTLAAAYAATGDFSKAVVIAERALELCKPSFKEEFENRLALYKAGKPYVGD